MENKKVNYVGDFIRNIGKLIAVQDVTPEAPPDRFDYIFEETTARIEAHINNVLVKEFATYNDFYGDGTCVSLAKKEAKRKR